MSDIDSQSFSRRKWLELTPVIAAASVGTRLLAGRASAEDQAPATATSDNLLGAKTYNIRDFGAKGDGTTLDTAAVKAAVEACSRDKGGTVLVPAGVFVIGTLELKSNVTLHIAAGGTLLGSGHGADYYAANAIPLSGDSTLNDGNVGLIFAVHAENITVEGPGTIDGQGSLFRNAVRGGPTPAGISGSHRPYHLMFYQCTNLRVRDIFLKDCAFHSMRIVQCNFAWFNGIHVHSRVNHNNDGFHFISCQHIYVSDCNIQCQDDACALFGSCKFVTITNSSFSTRWSVFRFGGGVAENITVSNCLIYDTFGCPIKMQGGGRSRFENISFSNIVMKNVTGPISISMGSRNRRATGAGAIPEVTNAPPATIMTAAAPPSTSVSATNTSANATPASASQELPGGIRNISFSGIRATVIKPFQITESEVTSAYNPGEVFSCIGLSAVGETFMENISFNDVHITFPGGGTAEQAALRDVPKVVGEYYAAGVFPAYGLYARKVRGLTLNNVRFELAATDLRPAVVFDHVEDAAIDHLSVQGVKEAESVMRFIDSKDVLMSATRLLTPGSVLLEVEGKDNANIVIDGGDLSKAEKPLAFKDGATESAVKLRG